MSVNRHLLDKRVHRRFTWVFFSLMIYPPSHYHYTTTIKMQAKQILQHNKDGNGNRDDSKQYYLRLKSHVIALLLGLLNYHLHIL